MNTLALAVVAANLHGLLISFLIMVIALAAIAGLIWCIERWISPIPPPVKMGIAIVLVLCVAIWAVAQFVPDL